MAAAFFMAAAFGPHIGTVFAMHDSNLGVNTWLASDNSTERHTIDLNNGPSSSSAEAGAATTSEETGENGDDGDCDPSYPGVCIPPYPPDLDCGDPDVPSNFKVSGSDPHRFDVDNNGIGCEGDETGSDVVEEEGADDEEDSADG